MKDKLSSTNSLLLQEIAKGALELSSGGVPFFTITHAEISGDFKQANIWFRALNKEENRTVLDFLTKSRYKLGQKLNNKSGFSSIPTLNFIPDEKD